jgi:hypothetical protein
MEGSKIIAPLILYLGTKLSVQRQDEAALLLEQETVKEAFHSWF